VIVASSSVYGANPTLPKVKNLATRPISPCAASKLATESYTLAWGHSYGLPVLAFRFFNVFGPLQAAGHAYAAAITNTATRFDIIGGCHRYSDVNHHVRRKPMA
jgi:UDP-glucose 4-epimerase